MSEVTIQTVLNELSEKNISKVKVAITDIDGILRGKYIHLDKFKSAAESGFGFCNVVFGWDCADVCYDNIDYTGWHSGYPDAKVKLDLSTKRNIPWDDHTPFFLGSFIDDNEKPLNICPRSILKSIVADAEAEGLSPQVGTEFEWFNFEESSQSITEKNFQNLKPLTPGMFGYSIIRSSQQNTYFNQLIDQLGAFINQTEALESTGKLTSTESEEWIE